MENPQTIGAYKRIQDFHPNADEYGVFFAFNKKQYDEAVERLTALGTLARDAKILYHPHFSGLYGTQENIDAFLEAYENRDKAIPQECDPQEVYFYEYNNYECMNSWDGDLDAVKVIVGYFGKEAARKITRIDAYYSIDKI